MLTCLEFDLMMPTAHSFGVAYCSLLNLGDPGRSLVSYLVDLSLMEGNVFLKYVPSIVAGSAVALARFVFHVRSTDLLVFAMYAHLTKLIIYCRTNFMTLISVATAVTGRGRLSRVCVICMRPFSWPPQRDRRHFTRNIKQSDIAPLGTP